jgi:hypothetical protein
MESHPNRYASTKSLSPNRSGAQGEAVSARLAIT